MKRFLIRQLDVKKDEEILNSIGDRTYEIVNKEPDKFQFGVFYVLRDGKRAYIYDLDES